MLDLVVKDQGLALYGDEYFFQDDFFKSVGCCRGSDLFYLSGG
jgi:hypothetical protein